MQLPNPLGHLVDQVTQIRSTGIRYLTAEVDDVGWETSTSIQVWNYDGVALKISMDFKVQWGCIHCI